MIDRLAAHLDLARPVPAAPREERIASQADRLKTDSLDLAGSKAPNDAGLQQLRYDRTQLLANRQRYYDRVVSLLDGETPAPLVKYHVRSIANSLTIPAKDADNKYLASRTAVNFSRSLLTERIPADQAELASGALRQTIDGTMPSDVTPFHQELLTHSLASSANNAATGDLKGLSTLEQARISSAALKVAGRPWSDENARVDTVDSASVILQNQAKVLVDQAGEKRERQITAATLRSALPHLIGLPAAPNGFGPYYNVARNLASAGTTDGTLGISAKEIHDFAGAQELARDESKKLYDLALRRARTTHPAVANVVKVQSDLPEGTPLEERLAFDQKRSEAQKALNQDPVGKQILLSAMPDQELANWIVKARERAAAFEAIKMPDSALIWHEQEADFSAELRKRGNLAEPATELGALSLNDTLCELVSKAEIACQNQELNFLSRSMQVMNLAEPATVLGALSSEDALCEQFSDAKIA